MKTEQLINNLFSALAAIFPAWKNAFQSQQELAEAKRQWLAALMDGGVTSMEKLNHGVSMARRHNSPFLPSCGIFVGWCQEYELVSTGFPDQDAFSLAISTEVARFRKDRKWESHHPAVYWAYCQKAYTEWRDMKSDKFDSVCSRLYKESRKKVMEGYKFEAYNPLQLKHEQYIPVDKEACLKNLEALKGLVND